MTIKLNAIRRAFRVLKQHIDSVVPKKQMHKTSVKPVLVVFGLLAYVAPQATLSVALAGLFAAGAHWFCRMRQFRPVELRFATAGAVAVGAVLGRLLDHLL